MLTIRDFRGDDADYAAMAAVSNQCLEGICSSDPPANFRNWDRQRDPKHAFYRFLGEVDGQVVAYAEVFEPWYFYAPGRWEVNVAVAEPFRGRGYGRALVPRIEQVLEDWSVNLLFAGCVEGAPGHGFATRRGFEVKVREPLTHLDLANLDTAPLAPALARLEAAGLRVDTATEVLATVPDAIERWWNLGWEIQQDIPFNRPSERRPLEVFAKRFEEVAFDSDLWYVARDAEDGTFAGLSGLRPTADDGVFNTAITGVGRGYRRKGVAVALKYAALAAAQARGGHTVHTDNEENNPMLGINKRLGFREVGAWLCLEREVA